MPTAPLAKCLERDCKVRVMRGYCAAHARPAWGRPEDRPKRIRGRALQKKRAYLFHTETRCRICKRPFMNMRDMIRDHIVPLAEGGTDATENTQPACRACSDAKTQQEALRGRMRAGLARK